MKSSNKIWFHLAFWIFFSIVPRLISPPAFHIDILFSFYLIIDLTTFYTLYFFIIPKYFDDGFNLKILISSILVIASLVMLRVWVSNIAVKYNEILLEQSIRSPFLYVLKEIISTILFVVYPLLVTFTIRYFSIQKAKIELESQKKESELTLLRSQINPHFLFNTLNNIYSLVYSNSPEAHKSITKLSELMRFTLYRSKDEKVPFESEIEYLETFIDLELLRIKDKRFIEKKITYQNNGLEIAPMLLIPFVENAFKHSDKSFTPPVIKLQITINNGKLEFYISNKKAIENNESEKIDGGIGLVNVKKRLEILYPDKFKLNIKNSKDNYEVLLKIELI